MKEKKVQIIIAYLYHAFFILLGFILMMDAPDALLTIAIVADILYLVYWIVLNRRSHMPWIVYLHFVIGSAVEIILNWFGIIPADGWMMSDMGQAIYLLFVLPIHAAIILIVNLVLWILEVTDLRTHI
ncbi:MAG: hypothetical protein J1D87_01380 [Lachnospiraceae bacterium]|nr:hypothetical protein [Lachnospiraceae bacterium]